MSHHLSLRTCSKMVMATLKFSDCCIPMRDWMQTYGSGGSWVSLRTRFTRDGCPVYSSLPWRICGTAVRVAILASTATLSILCPRICSQLLAAAVVPWGTACFYGH